MTPGSKVIARTTLYWYEPRPLRRRRLGEMGKLFPWRLWFLGALLVAVLQWALSDSPLRLDTPQQWRVLGEAIGKGTLLALMPFLSAVLFLNVPSPVKVTDLGFYRSGWTLWEQVDHARLERLECEGAMFDALILVFRNGGKTSVGIAPHLSLRQVEEALRMQGIAVVRHPSALTF